MSDLDALYQACRAGDLPTVTALLDAGVSPDAVVSGAPVLLHAAQAGKGEVAELLLARGARLDVESGRGTNLLAAAVAGVVPALVERCVAAGQRIDRARPDGMHLLEFALETHVSFGASGNAGVMECLALLHRGGHDLDQPVFPVRGGGKVTLLAASTRDAAMFDHLLGLGCSLDRAIDTARHTGSRQALERMVAHAAITPAQRAALTEALAALEAVADGAAARQRAEQASARAAAPPEQLLVDAVLDGDLAACAQLLDDGARPDAEVTIDDEATTALAVAEREHADEIVELFEARGFMTAAEAALVADGLPERRSGAAPGFSGKAFGLIVAGTARRIDVAHALRYRALAERHAASTGLPLIAAVAGDEHEYMAGAGTVVVGLEVASCDADDIGTRVPARARRPAADLLAEVPAALWAELAALDAEVGAVGAEVSSGAEVHRDDDSADDDDDGDGDGEAAPADAAAPALYLLCTGPLSATYLVYGVPGGRVTAARTGQQLHRGQDNEQQSHRVGVVGRRVHFAQQESPDVLRIDLQAPYLARIVEALPPGDFYLVTRYD